MFFPPHWPSHPATAAHSLIINSPSLLLLPKLDLLEVNLDSDMFSFGTVVGEASC